MFSDFNNNIYHRELVDSDSSDGGGDNDDPEESGPGSNRGTEKKRKSRKKKPKKKKTGSTNTSSPGGVSESAASSEKAAQVSLSPREMLEKELQANAERERQVTSELLARFSSSTVTSTPAQGEVTYSPISEGLSPRILAAIASDHTSELLPPLPPPPLERLAVEKNVILGVIIERPSKADTQSAYKQTLFTPVCEVLTYLHSEYAQNAVEEYISTPQFTPLSASATLNPYRMRCLSVHSWMLLLLLESSRTRPRGYLFSENPTRNEYCVWGAEVVTARDQLRRLDWFGYDYKRVGSRVLAAWGPHKELIVKDLTKAPETEADRRTMVELIEGVATKYCGCGRYFEAVHVLEEGVDIARSLLRSSKYNNSVPEDQQVQQQVLIRLLHSQLTCLTKLGRTVEGFRLRSKLESTEIKALDSLGAVEALSVSGHSRARRSKRVDTTVQ
jgi:hypothetical protein